MRATFAEGLLFVLALLLATGASAEGAASRRTIWSISGLRKAKPSCSRRTLSRPIFRSASPSRPRRPRPIAASPAWSWCSTRSARRRRAPRNSSPTRSSPRTTCSNDKTDAILPRDVLLHRGMTLDQLGRIFSLYPVTVEVHHADDRRRRRVPQAGERNAREQEPLRHRQLLAQDAGRRARRPYFAACGL